MYKIGDKVVYGQVGVCTITDICEKVLIKRQKREYYVLKPVDFDNNLIYAPIENGKVYMRHLISKEEANKLIDSIPSIIDGLSGEEEITKEEYTKKINNHSLNDLVELTAFIYSKKRNAQTLKKRLNAIDEKYMKISENLLFGELAAVLEIPINQVQGYIEKRIEK